MPDRDQASALPLKPAWFHILLTVAEESAHGYSIRKAVEARTDGSLKLWPTTLYGALSDLSELGYVCEEEAGDEPDDKLGRIRYGLTDLGGRVLAAEATRMEALVGATRAAQATRPRTV